MATFKRSSRTFALGQFYLLLVIQVNLQFSMWYKTRTLEKNLECFNDATVTVNLLWVEFSFSILEFGFLTRFAMSSLSVVRELNKWAFPWFSSGSNYLKSSVIIIVKWIALWTYQNFWKQSLWKPMCFFNKYRLEGKDATNKDIHGICLDRTVKKAWRNWSSSSIPRSAILQ